ncbi:trichohyalin-like isoform X2 [Coccinella septempunctata]|uniref:trichohyalin-like isoform X2 n=1 Tax=Coccinella septempunctata TaxID=41139 RepID=UPI001D05EEB3|nr:trichohyalin-like isoform X2 [Coccinella septempunctata]
MDSYELHKAHKINESDEVASSSSHNTSENDGNSELKDEVFDSYPKPTFKNALQAKKRLQAFAAQKLWSSSSCKTKCNEKSLNEHNESQAVSVVGLRTKKENPMDKAKATIEEIELLKLAEFSQSISVESEEKLIRRSRSKSSEPEFVFRKRERKVRNYRRSDNSRRSPSPTITTAREKYAEKSKCKYPRNWEEFIRDKWTFEKLMCKDSHFKSKIRNAPNDIFRQLLFDTPPAPIKPFHYKNERGDDLNVPYKFLRYTSAKPRIAYNVNMFKQKEPFLNRHQVLERTNRDFRVILEKFYSKNKKRCKPSEPIGQRNWYQKNWRDVDSKVLETSIGLSFLQTYSDDEEEEEPYLDPNELTRQVEKFIEEKKRDKVKLNERVERETRKIANDFLLEDFAERADRKSISLHVSETVTKKKENVKIEENMSWTPERKPLPTEDMCLFPPEMKKLEFKLDEEKVKIAGDKDEKIVSEDEWAETPERKSADSDKDKKKKKKSKKGYSSEDSDSSDEKRSKKKKKRKLERKKKQREKEKKSRKKEKLKAEKFKKEKKKQKEKEKKKEILKKLKKEFLEEEERTQKQIETQVKVEKYEAAEPEEDLKKCLRKTHSDQGNTEMTDDRRSKKEEQIEELIEIKVKKEKLPYENKEEKQEENLLQIKEKNEEKLIVDKGDKEEMIPGEETPDTEEYQSNWESDDGISPIVKPSSKKSSRGWESDEEVFERAFSKKQPGDNPFAGSSLLEMPLDIKFPRRRFGKQEKRRSRTRSPEYLDMEKEIKILAAERMNLNKERMQLEMEKIRIHELERKKSMEEMEQRSRGDPSPGWHKPQSNHDKWHTKDSYVESRSKERREKEEQVPRSKAGAEKPDETTGVVLTVHSSPEITSTKKSPTHTVLESVYQEFMKAVTGGDDARGIVISSTDDADNKTRQHQQQQQRTKVKYSRSQRDRNRRRSVETAEEPQLLITTDPKILNEILLPGEAPEVPPPVPAPVPSPKTDLTQNLMPVVVKSVPQVKFDAGSTVEAREVQRLSDGPQEACDKSSPVKPFSFSTLVIPSKRSLLVEPNWKLDDDSEEEQPSNRKMEDVEAEPIELQQSINEPSQETEMIEGQDEEKLSEERRENQQNEEMRIEERSDRRKPSRSRSPLDTSRDKRRKQDDGGRRRDEEKRRESGGRRGEEVRRREGETKGRDNRSKRPSSPSRRREPSPRRRRFSSPVHRRSSPPRHRSPSRRVQSRRPERSDRRSPPARTSPSKRRRSYSPPRPSPRRRSPSPRDASSKSPRLSPMEGLKRSVADSTISDDLLPQLYPAERPSSPLCSSTPAQSCRRMRLTLSPKRPSLDERINQVLGIESQPPPTQTWRPAEPQTDPRQNALYSGYHQHATSIDVGYPPKVPQASKVLQVGNNLQVVPSEDLCAPPPPPQPVQAPPSQKILQVGNMLQIVPSDMEPIIPPPPPKEPPRETPPPVVKTVPDRQSAEDVLVERMAERTKKRQEKEERRKEKEKKKKDKDKKRKMRLKVSTEEMIKRALELDGYIGTEGENLSAMVPEVVNDTPGLDPSRSILSTSTLSLKSDRERKSVQFADGVRPGEGTSPSGGEELSSPPPQTEVLLKPKKYKRLGSIKKKKKKKLKVKKMKKQRTPPPPSPTASDEEYENLPPPSPPPGSPPSHVFPPRAKVHTINNIPQHYLPSYGITTAPQTPVVQPQSRINLAYQTPPTAMYRTPPPHVANQHYPRMGHAPPMGMNVPPPTASMHRDQPPYGTF